MISGLEPRVLHVVGTERPNEVFIVWRGGDGEAARYAVADGYGGSVRVLNHASEWEWEPQPSSRTDEFIARTRYGSVGAAFEAYKAHVRQKWQAAGEELLGGAR